LPFSMIEMRSSSPSTERWTLRSDCFHAAWKRPLSRLFA
jgi:hypothetical protein